MTTPSPEERLLLDAAGYEAPPSYAWTEQQVSPPLRSADVTELTRLVLDGLAQKKVVLPDPEDLVRRSVVGLLSGHVVLQGPPGTGKTTLARLLADAFRVRLTVTTATADWSTYDVIGGLHPSSNGQLAPRLGVVTAAALACASAVREEGDLQAEWLLLDELNRADIDKAIGPLYTVLSSVTAEHLASSPVELWFAEGDASRLWVPGRFRIIGTMNDVDTSFVNLLSQGLARRFQFLYVGVPGRDDTKEEVRQALFQARSWVTDRYPDLAAVSEEQLEETTADLRGRVVGVVEGLRWPSGGVPGWPLGTAQVVDLWRTVLLQAPTGTGLTVDMIIDEAVADRIVPQMGTIDRAQLDAFQAMFASATPPLTASAAAVSHLANPHTPL